MRGDFLLIFYTGEDGMENTLPSKGYPRVAVGLYLIPEREPHCRAGFYRRSPHFDLGVWGWGHPMEPKAGSGVLYGGMVRGVKSFSPFSLAGDMDHAVAVLMDSPIRGWSPPTPVRNRGWVPGFPLRDGIVFVRDPLSLKLERSCFPILRE